MFFYFLEIKYKIFFIVLCWFNLILLNYYYKELILFILIKPCSNIVINKEIYFVYSNITEILHNYIIVVLFLSTIITFCFAFFHIIDFIKLGLYSNEISFIKNYIYYNTVFNFFFFFLCYYYVAPQFWKFFLSYSTSNTVNFNFFFEIKLEEYLYFYYSIFKIGFIISQIITLLYFWVKINIKYIIIYKNTRKRIHILLIITSTIITPPDIVSQLIVSFMFIVIYEFFIYCFIFKKLTR